MAQTAAERQNAWRQRKKDQGLVRFEVLVPLVNVAEMRDRAEAFRSGKPYRKKRNG